jgi:hypothetical protein
MSTSGSFVDRVRPLVADLPLGERLFVVALLESQSAERYRQWAAGAADPDLARGFAECGEREDRIADAIRAKFAAIVKQPDAFGALAQKLQAEVVAVFGGRTSEEQFQIQAGAERGGEQLWADLAANEQDAGAKQVFLECASLEAASAAFLESLK